MVLPRIVHMLRSMTFESEVGCQQRFGHNSKLFRRARPFRERHRRRRLRPSLMGDTARSTCSTTRSQYAAKDPSKRVAGQLGVDQEEVSPLGQARGPSFFEARGLLPEASSVFRWVLGVSTEIWGRMLGEGGGGGHAEGVSHLAYAPSDPHSSPKGPPNAKEGTCVCRHLTPAAVHSAGAHCAHV